MRKSSASCERHAGALDEKDVSFERFLARLRHKLSAEARVFARMRVQGYDAADPARASARAIAEEWSAEAAGSPGHLRPQGGYGALLDWLAAGLGGSRVELRLRSVVRAVRWERGAVEITCTRDEGGGMRDEGGGVSRKSPLLPEEGCPRSGRGGGSDFLITARRAIVTLPLGVLKAAATRGRRGPLHAAPPGKARGARVARIRSGDQGGAAVPRGVLGGHR